MLFRSAKDVSGVYIFTTKDGSIYVGSSVSLYNRVISYFMPSILQNANRRVLHYFKTHGFTTTTLTLHIISSSSAMTSLELEQYFLDTLKPNLNVDKFANSTGFHVAVLLGRDFEQHMYLPHRFLDGLEIPLIRRMLLREASAGQLYWWEVKVTADPECLVW